MRFSPGLDCTDMVNDASCMTTQPTANASNMGGLDLTRLKDGFTGLLSQAEPAVLPAFLLWVDLKVSEYKVHGYMFSDPDNRYEGPWLQMAVDSLNFRFRGFRPDSQPPLGPLQEKHLPLNTTHIATPSSPVVDLSKNIKRELCTPEKGKISALALKTMGKYSPISTASQKALNFDVQVPSPSLPVPDFSADKTFPAKAPSVSSTSQNLVDKYPVVSQQLTTKTPSTPPSHGLPLKKRERKDERVESPKPMLKVPIVSSSESAVSMSNPPVSTIVPCAPYESVSTPLDVSGSPAPGMAPYETDLGHVTGSPCPGMASSQSLNGMSPTKINGEKEAFMQSIANVCADALSWDGKKGGKNLICTVCDRQFQYSSSYRRHMKLHQGVYTHMCAVCHRKFTRKEHFVRHKCNRRPNKPSRSADDAATSSTGKVPKLEYPPSMTPQKGENKENATNSSPLYPEAEYAEDMPMTDFEPLDYSSGGVASPSTSSNGGESRRKSSKPRRCLPMDIDGEGFNYDEEAPDFIESHSPSQKTSGSDHQDSSFEKLPEAGSPPPLTSAMPAQAAPTTDDETTHVVPGTRAPQLPSVLSEYDSANTPSSTAASDEGHEEGKLEIDLSEPEKLPPASGEMSDAVASMLALDTGNYVVSTISDAESGGEDVASSPGKFIKVVKHSNYLKLQKEARMIGNQKCYVCPHANCQKVFHRSSNFSRHMRTHRGVFSYMCPNCNRGFFRKEHIQKHKCSRKAMTTAYDRKTKIDLEQDQDEHHDAYNGGDANGQDEYDGAGDLQICEDEFGGSSSDDGMDGPPPDMPTLPQHNTASVVSSGMEGGDHNLGHITSQHLNTPVPIVS